MKFKLEFDMNNAAFDNEEKGFNRAHISNILEEMGEKVFYSNEFMGSIRDLNGNKIGKWEIKGARK